MCSTTESSIDKKYYLLIGLLYFIQTKKMDLLCNYLVYIKDCSEQPGYGIKEAEVIHLLKDSVVLITNQGPKLPSKETIHFSSSYLPDPDFENLFPGNKHVNEMMI